MNARRVSHGRKPSDGLDCCGFLLWVYRECGLPIDEIDLEYDGAGELWTQSQINARLSTVFRELTTGELRAGLGANGDVWVMREAGRVFPMLRVGPLLWKMSDRLRAFPIDGRNISRWRVWRHRLFDA